MNKVEALKRRLMRDISSTSNTTLKKELEDMLSLLNKSKESEESLLDKLTPKQRELIIILEGI